jgi:hypothetical protein
MKRPVRLASFATELPEPEPLLDAEYVPDLGYTVVTTPQGRRPLVEVAPDSTTQSKTYQAPVDDDQDPDDRACY